MLIFYPQGASSGIGLATRTFFLSLGAHVIGGDLNPSPPYVSSNNNFTFVPTDVTKWSDLTTLFKTAAVKHGRIDHVFANAGISGRTTLLDEKLDENGDLLEPSHIVLDINLRGVVNTVALGLHYMRKQESGGSIVLTASASSFQRFRAVDYTTAKHGVLGLMRGLTPLLVALPQSIRINAISPSWTATGLVPAEFIEKYGGVPTQGPEVVARSVAVLMSDKDRAGQLIYSVEGKYFEIEETLLEAAKRIVGDNNEDLVMARLLEAMSNYGISDALPTKENEPDEVLEK